MAKITTAQILANSEQIDKLSANKDAIRKQSNTDIQHLKYNVYQPRIRQIEQKRDKAIAKIEASTEATITTLNNTIDKHYAIIKQSKFILACLETNTNKNLNISDDEVEVYERYGKQPYKQGLGYLFDDDYLKIKMFIVGNSKPVNKYSLIAIGRSCFTEPLIKYPRSYGLDINDYNKEFNIETWIKDAPTPQELKKYYIKHQKTILEDTISEYQKLKVEYIQAISDYTISDFQDLITWACPKCNNFYSIFDSFSPNYTPQCCRHDPYENMVKTNKGKS